MERGSLEGDLIENGGWQNEATEPWCSDWISSYWGADGAAPETGGTETYSSGNELGTLLNPPTSFPSLYSVSVSSQQTCLGWGTPSSTSNRQDPSILHCDQCLYIFLRSLNLHA